MHWVGFLLVWNFVVLNEVSSFDLILNIEGNKNSFRFVELTGKQILPSMIILDDELQPTVVNSSSIHVYRVESHDDLFSIATLINRSLFAVVQISHGTFYDIIPSIFQSQSRSKRSINNDFVVKHKGFILPHAHVSIQWQPTRLRRTTQKSSKKSRHLYLEIIALTDSLIFHDIRTLLNHSEFETIEILKLYYIHIFIGVEQLYKQSLTDQTLDVHIRLTKLIFSTSKYRLPWESLKDIPYRKSPTNPHLRPNISMNLLKSLHPAYTSSRFDLTADHIMTFTRLDLINGAGSAYVSGLCSPSHKYSIIQEDFNSFSTMMTVTHELGHNLGLNHDEIENECNNHRIKYIMSPKTSHTINRHQVPYFSQCSIKQLNQFVDKTKTKCWKNKIVSIKQIGNLFSSRLGEIINLRQQCQLQYGLEAIPFLSIRYNQSQALYEETICSQLNCLKRLRDHFMYSLDGALDGTSCGENRICYQKKCIKIKGKIKRTDLARCPYGDLFLPMSMLNLKGNMLCSDALNLLRSRGMNVTYLCYDSILPYQRLCCEECKKHLIPECGDLHSKCPTFIQYCKNKFIRIDGQPMTQLCPYTCGKCPPLSLPPAGITTTTSKPRKYIKPRKFTQYTCIDMADCSQLLKIYSKLNKNVKNWCAEYSTTINGRYFVEICPKYCRLCTIISECDRSKLCRNNGRCIRNEYGTYQCICSSAKPFYGTLCEYRRTCLSKPCSSKTEFCVQTQGEDYVCLSKADKENMRVVLNSTWKDSRRVS